MASLIPDYHTGTSSSKQFQLRFSTHHKGLIKTNENHSVITKNLTRYFVKNVTTDYCDSDQTLADTKDYMSDTTEVISKPIGEMFRKPPGEYQLFNISTGVT